MSRVGKQPITIPQGVKAAIANGVVQVEGPRGKLLFRPARKITVTVADGTITVTRGDDEQQTRADHGTARAYISNMVQGVSTGWKRTLELNGVGFTAKAQGQKLTLAVGFSHDVEIELPPAIKLVVVKNTIELESADRELVGTFASKIRKVQPPEPYLGKGIKYKEETIRRKAGKAGKK